MNAWLLLGCAISNAKASASALTNYCPLLRMSLAVSALASRSTSSRVITSCCRSHAIVILPIPKPQPAEAWRDCSTGLHGKRTTCITSTISVYLAEEWQEIDK